MKDLFKITIIRLAHRQCTSDSARAIQLISALIYPSFNPKLRGVPKKVVVLTHLKKTQRDYKQQSLLTTVVAMSSRACFSLADHARNDPQ